MPSRPLPLMTADERYERAKTHAFIRAHCELARIFLAVWNEKKEANRAE